MYKICALWPKLYHKWDIFTYWYMYMYHYLFQGDFNLNFLYIHVFVLFEKVLLLLLQVIAKGYMNLMHLCNAFSLFVQINIF